MLKPKKIKSIKSIGKGKTFDIVNSMPNNNFFIGNTLVHNSMLLDEINFRKEFDIYDSVKRRISSRFKLAGTNPGMFIMISSQESKNALLNKHISKVRGLPYVHVSDYPLWEIKDKSVYYPSNKFFKVMVGDAYMQSKIVANEAEAPLGYEVIDVPMEHWDDFQGDVDKALMEIAGKAVEFESTLIPRKDLLNRCINMNRNHPFMKESITLGLNSSELIQEYFDVEELFSIRESIYVPKINPETPRFIHVDLSSTEDRTGIAMCHVCGFVPTSTVIMDNLQRGELARSAPIVYLDWAIQIIPLKESEIDITKIRSFIVDLPNYGYSIAKVTYDKYESRESIQNLKKQGFNAEHLSVDRDKAPYNTFRQLIIEGRIDLYPYEPLLVELRTLQRDLNGKVDHLPGNSKDVADAVCGAAYSAVMSPDTANIEAQAPPIRGGSSFSNPWWMNR